MEPPITQADKLLEEKTVDGDKPKSRNSQKNKKNWLSHSIELLGMKMEAEVLTTAFELESKVLSTK